MSVSITLSTWQPASSNASRAPVTPPGAARDHVVELAHIEQFEAIVGFKRPPQLVRPRGLGVVEQRVVHRRHRDPVDDRAVVGVETANVVDRFYYE